jgi:superfamily II DNA or RNA helicase
MEDLRIDWKLTPRPSQQAILDLIFGSKADEDKWYIVNPPGSGKTILGLMVALRMRVPTLVLAPNTAIQMQWVAKAQFFLPDDGADQLIASVDPEDAAPITVLTYQAIARVRQMESDERRLLLKSWREELVEDGREPIEAREWLERYEAQNPERFQASLLRRWKKLRKSHDAASELAELVVDDDARRLMTRFRERGVRLVILDECHHLVGYWAQVGIALKQTLRSPQILGLTATPPSASDIDDQEVELHKALLDEIDFMLPTPAVVRDGNLAPYQDLVYFTRPSAEEFDYISACSNQFGDVRKLAENHAGTTLSAWLSAELEAIPSANFASTLRRRSGFITAAVRYLRAQCKPVPKRYKVIQDGELALDALADLMGRYASDCLLVSESQGDRDFFRELNHAFRPLGFQLTEKGLRHCQSNISRVLALSQAKIAGAIAILREELQHHDDLRALVITDFEKSSATIHKDIADLLDAESGGAIAVMRALTSDPDTDTLDPILVTGQSLLVDDDLLPQFEKEAKAWFAARGLEVTMTPELEGGFYRIRGQGGAWSTRNYVAMVTALFEKGVTRCLVGTRGLLGEGWDALCANTLIDLTTAATKMTVNQLRGRSIRLDPKVPRKVANNWDVVCLAPEFEKGLSDYHRFARKHKGYYGICDDGSIEFGLGHIHPSLTEAGPEDVALNAHVLNAEMFQRAADREAIYKAWKVGEPYENTSIPSLEIKDAGGFIIRGSLDKMKAYEVAPGSILEQISRAVLDALIELKLIRDVKAAVEVRARADEYFRIFLNSASPEDVQLFSRSMNELFMPVAEQRYIIPRYEQVREHSWLSRLLPRILFNYTCRKTNRIAIYHALPACLGESKARAEVFSDKWELYVSPGRAIFTKRGKGEATLIEAKRLAAESAVPKPRMKEVWH